MTSETMKISFIIPVLNGEKHLDQCLAHIGSEMSGSDEIIVVDNGSTDNTVSIARRRENVRVLEHPELTVGGLRNRGAQISSGDVLAFIDSDCLLQKGWRRGVVETLSDPTVHATGSICDLPPSPTWVERAWSASKSESPRCVEYIPSANLVIRRAVFLSVGGFDETLVTDEDYDIGVKITRSGGRIIDAPTVRSIHLGNSKTLAQFVSRQKWHATSIIDSLARHGWDKPMIMTVCFMFACLIALLSIPAAALWGRSALIGTILPLLAPVITALFRIRRNGEARYFPHLVVLYLLFYLVRSLALLENLRKLRNRR